MAHLPKHLHEPRRRNKKTPETVLASGEYPCGYCGRVVISEPLYNIDGEWVCTTCYCMEDIL